MIGYVVLIVFGLGVIGTAGGYAYGIADGKRLARAADIEAQWQAEKAVEEKKAAVAAEAEKRLTDMEAAFEAGKAEARIVYVKTQAKGAADVAKYPVFSDPRCVLPDDSLRNVNAARSGDVRAAADPAPVARAVSAAAPVVERIDGGDVRNDAAGRAAVRGVQVPARALGGGGDVQGNGVRPPKPAPRGAG